jgi:glycosyltransferase involved in cell wall biosynthesis
VHEDYLALLGDRAWSRGMIGVLARGMVRAATALGRRADLTVLADEHIPPSAARHRLVVRNLPDPAMLPSRGPLDPEPRALYVGDIRTSRGLFVMLDAIRAAPPWSLDLVGPVAPADELRLKTELQADPGLAARVRLHGRMEPRASWSFARGAWAGFLMLEATEAFDPAVPTKLYEYLACGLPVIATPLTRQAQIVNQSAGGVVVSGAEDASALLLRWARAAAEVSEIGDRGRAWWESGAAGASGYAELASAVVTLLGRT